MGTQTAKRDDLLAICSTTTQHVLQRNLTTAAAAKLRQLSPIKVRDYYDESNNQVVIALPDCSSIQFCLLLKTPSTESPEYQQ